MKGSTAARIGIEIGAAFSGNFKSVFGAASGEVQKIGAAAAQANSKLSSIKAFEKLTADTKQAGYAWQAAKQNLDQLTRSTAQYGEQIKRSGEALKAAQAEQKRTAQAVAFHRETLARAQAEMANGKPTADAKARLVQLREELKKSQQAHQESGEAVKKHGQELRNAEKSAQAQSSAIAKAKDSTERAGAAFSKSRERLGEMRAELDKSGVSTKDLATQQQALQRQLDATAARMKKVGDAQAGMQRGKTMMADAGMALGAVTAAAATAGAPIVQAARFETAMLGVAKQVEGARDESGKLTSVYYNMAKQVQQLGREIPIATNELAAMVAAGSRMGVAKDELIQFTRTAAMMAEAFELPAAELADQMGKIAGLYKIPIPAIGALADTINYLDDNAISKGGDIIDFMTRVGGVASAIKITDKEMAALGSTLLTLGERTETASTATNAMFQKFAAADKGTKKFKSAMKEIGLSTAEVQKGMQQDSMGTMLKLLDAVAKLDPEQRLGVLTELVGLEHSDTLAKLAGNTGELRKQLAMANSEMAKGSMQKEFAARLETTNAQWTIMKNQLTEVSVNLGSVLLPTVNSVIGAIGSATSGMAEFVTENKTLVGNVLAVVGTLGGLFAATKIAALGIGAITFAFHALKLAMLTNPIGIALTALTVAGVLLWKNWEGVKGGLVAIWETIKDAGTTASTWLSQAWGKAAAVMSAGFDGMLNAGRSVIGWFRENQWAQSLVPVVGAGIYLADNWDMIKDRLSAVWTAISDTAIAAFDSLSSGIGAAMTAINEKMVASTQALTAAWNLAAGGLSVIWGSIRDTAIAAFDSIKTAVGGVIDWLAEKTAWIFQTVDKVKAAANSIGDGIGGAWSGAKNLVGLGPSTPPATTSAAAAAGGTNATGVTNPAAAGVAAVPAMGGNTSTANSSINAPITINGATDPAATARAVRAELDKREREQAAVRRAMLTDKAGY